jgi:hypothetical protein
VSSEEDGHPVVAGLVALVGVGVVVGLLVSGGALAATSVLGLGDSGGGSTSSAAESMYMPKPSDSVSASGPLVTLAPDATTSAPVSESPSASESPASAITLSSAQVSVSPMQEIALSGTYATGEGAVVQVQRLEEGQWVDFSSVDAVVSGGTFSTYVLTARTGINKFRVRDTDTDEVSNAVRVRVG